MTDSVLRGSLSCLIHPYTSEYFFLTFWENRYCHITTTQNPGLLEFAQSLFSFDEADRILTTPGPRFRDAVRMSNGGQSIPREDICTDRQNGLVVFDVDRILSLYDRGATIILNRVHEWNKPLKELCNDLSKCFRARISANAYVTPPNSQGFPAHSDTHDVILLQIDGQKRWNVQSELEFLSSPRVPNVTSDPVNTGNWDALYLQAGEAIYIPRGIIHEGIADASHSLHVTLGIHPYTWFDLLRDVVFDLEKKDDLLRRSATNSTKGFEEMLGEVSSKLALCLSRADTIKHEMTKRTMDLHDDTSNRGKLRRMAEPQHISLNTPIRSRPNIEVYLQRKADEVELRFGQKALMLPLFTRPLLQMILDAKSITPAELPSNIDDDGKLTIVRRLVAEGVLEVFPPVSG